MSGQWIVPEWEAPAAVRALVTTRHGGVSLPPYDAMNLGGHVGDAEAAVAQNRAILRALLPAEPKWLKQVHATAVAEADAATGEAEADASVARCKGTVCAVMVADCLPLLLCDRAGTVVAAAHAGWRGLAAGVIERTVRAMGVEPGSLMVYLGPAIGPGAFEVGDEVRQAFTDFDREAAAAFAPAAPGKWLADIYLLARQRLARLGVERVSGGGFCTYTEKERFFSYRRDRATGRMAALIWLDE